MNLPNIEYAGDYAKFIENVEDPNECISFYKDASYFEDQSTYNKFVKSVETMVRASDDYKAFIRWVKNTVGINFCQVSSNIIEFDEPGFGGKKDTLIEMHHGPLFTLYDYVSIILNKYIDNKLPISTFVIANEVIEEHFALRVQVVMLTKTNHEGVHNRDIFLNLKQGLGDIGAFIKKYANYLTDDQKYRVYRYILLCKENDSYDNGLLDIDSIAPLVVS